MLYIIFYCIILFHIAQVITNYIIELYHKIISSFHPIWSDQHSNALFTFFCFRGGGSENYVNWEALSRVCYNLFIDIVVIALTKEA